MGEISPPCVKTSTTNTFQRTPLAMNWHGSSIAKIILFWHVHDELGGILPLASRFGPIGALYTSPESYLDWNPGIGPKITSWLIGSTLRYDTTNRTNGGVVTIWLVWAPFERVAAFLGAWPAVCGVWRGWRISRRCLSVRRVLIRRHRRLAMGRCTCGYDLRMSRARCPECGRAFRRVPVTVA